MCSWNNEYVIFITRHLVVKGIVISVKHRKVKQQNRVFKAIVKAGVDFEVACEFEKKTLCDKFVVYNNWLDAR